jgi:toxin FitB
MFLLDTCAISEGNKPLPEIAFDSWFAAQDQNQLFLSAISVGEIRYGIDLLPHGKKRTALQHWFDETVMIGFRGRVVPFELKTALCWGDLRARYPGTKLLDAQIAATALATGLTLVTRNMKDFPFHGLQVLNPWQK